MKKFAVIGNPVVQSKSPMIHENFAAQFGIELEYSRLLSPINAFEKTVETFFNCGGVGLNVTMPFKEQAFAMCDRLSDRAKIAEAVNTLYLKDGAIVGDTTDGEGVVRDLAFHNIELKDKRVLLIGAGGAAKGSVSSILSRNPQSLAIANRTARKAQDIADNMADARVVACGFNEVESNYDVIINSTSCSLTGEMPALDAKIFENAQAVYDMCYKDETTLFNIWASKHGNVKTLDGLGMLIEQAAESFFIWHGKMPNTSGIRTDLSKTGI